MGESTIFGILLLGWFALAAGMAIVLSVVTAPYGRHVRRGWGPTMGNRLGWVIMEAPAPLVFGFCFVGGTYRSGLTAWVFLLMWQAHYVHRAFIYPFSLHSTQARMPLLIVVFGFVFNGLNGYLNGRWLFTFSGGYPDRWLADPRFVLGLLLFVAGYVINRRADGTLRRLRQEMDHGYGIPHGGLYRWISCPNYFGEIVQWSGWALATWSLPGLAFAVWAAANLAPRAQSHHRWYQEHFAEYPPERKALVPGVW
ncbi:MAG: DUF1295 domain-containing protein [Anaerolineae bacterium]|jgi:protein-S-isoprenylcysteine O-methyltransferase Ste14